jgi:oligoribonuclease NrnB/cAMP/cGMP phosphodiesterase (DHH superfamily)
MDDRLIDDDGIPLARRTQLPGKGFFYPDSLDEERADERVSEAVAGAEAVVIADTDADGLGCVALVREARGAALDATTFEAAIAARLGDEPLGGDGHGAAAPDGDGDDGPAVDGADAATLAEDAAARLAAADLSVDPPAEAATAASLAEALDTARDDQAAGDDDSEAVGVGTEAAALAEDDPVALDAGADAGALAVIEAAADAERGRSSVALVGSGPYNLGESLARVAAAVEPGADVYVCDLCPDEVADVAAPLEALVEVAGTIRWFDHHQWDDEVATAVREAGVDLVVGDSEAECSTDVTLRSLAYDFPDRFRELAAVTRDHDLWLKEDARSDDLADYAYWTDAEEYVTVVGEYGADLPAAVEAYLEERRVEKQRRIDLAIDRAELREVGPWTVATTYGRCSQNEVAEALREAGADAAVIVKPAGSASLRGSETFQRCHEVARQVNGGGHPKAAGCKPDIYDDMLDYAHHWTTQGATTKRVILAAFERVAEEAAADEGVTEADEADDADGGGDGGDADADADAGGTAGSDGD